MGIRDLDAGLSADPLLSRRAFVGVAGAAAAVVAGTALFGCAPKEELPAEELAEGESAPEPVDPVQARVDELLGAMSEHERICQLFCVAPESLTGLGQVTQAGPATQEALAAVPVGGLIYFAQNLLDSGQTSEMLAATRGYAMEACGIPPLLATDEEGGSVTRIAGKPGFDVANVGDMADVGAAGDVAAAQAAAETIGGYLSTLGFNTDFAPVADVANNPNSDTMRRRSFGADPELVADMVAAQVEGFRAADVLCSAKHFPGIGAAVGDSHDSRIVFEGSLSDLEAMELVPFQAAVEAGVPMVMVGHLSLPQVAGSDAPACLSPAIVTDLLRTQLGFQGVAITDSLAMGAVGEYYDTAEAVLLALEAGCDMLLMPADLTVALDAVRGALDSGRLTWERIDESVGRILRAKVEYLEF